MSTHLYDLQYFKEICNTKNISRAAERLGVTQPTLTHSIRRLEVSMGTALLIRSKKGVELTHAGLRLRQQAQDLIQKWEELKFSTRTAHEEVSGVMRLGVHVSVALYSLPHFLPELMKKYTQLEVQLTHNLSRHVTDDVINLRLDLGLVINPTAHPDLVIRKLAEDKVTIWGTKQKSDVLIYDPNLLQSQFLLRKLKKSKDLYSRSIQTTSLELATSLAEQGAGHALLPERVVKQNTKLSLQRISGTPEYIDEVALIYRAENKSLRLTEAFAEAIKKIFKS